MRRINTTDFQTATRSTSRDINLKIALNLIRDHQSISRAELARRMNVGRGFVSVLVNLLIEEGSVYEGSTGEALRGRKPTFLYVRTNDRIVVAVDVRFSHTSLMLTDFSGRQIALESFPTIFEPDEFVTDLADKIKRLLKHHGAESSCEGIGVVVPGMIDYRTNRILNAPTLGWHDIDLLANLEFLTGFPVQIENAAKACALAQMWLGRNRMLSPHNFVHVSVSDGVGVGIVMNGELIRGENGLAGEYGHIPLSLDGPKCVCGSQGCWETYISNVASLSRYLGRDLFALPHSEAQVLTISDVIIRAQSGDAKALEAVQMTGHYLGLGLANIVHSINPSHIYIGGEITTAWDLIVEKVREGLASRALTPAAAQTPIQFSPMADYPRLRGAAALLFASAFAAPRVA